jgi:outer membrane biosynthesis protein TonB
MAGEFAEFMSQFAAIGPALTSNIRLLQDDTELQKVVDIYAAGLNASLAGTAQHLTDFFNALPESQRADIDSMVAATGGREMLSAAATIMANTPIGTNTALAYAPSWIELGKKIIENFLPPGVNWPKALEKIDLILDALKPLIGQSRPPAPPAPKSQPTPTGPQPPAPQPPTPTGPQPPAPQPPTPTGPQPPAPNPSPTPSPQPLPPEVAPVPGPDAPHR